MATAFDRWEKDPFFYAAEEVQESTDRMESAYRRWMHEKGVAVASGGNCGDFVVELRREVHTALGTAKWQLEELEKAVRYSDHALAAGEATVTRHGDFVAAIRSNISMVEKALKESNLEEEGESGLAWVQLDEGERDELALFLSGSRAEVEKVLPSPAVGVHEAGNRMNEEASVCKPFHNNELPSLEMMEDKLKGHRRAASACADLGVWKISVSTEESPRKLSDKQANLPPPRILSLSELKTVESAPKPKWYRNGFRKWKAVSHEDMEQSIPLQNHQLTRGMNACYEKSKSCLGDFTDDSTNKQLYGWFGAFQRQIQRSQYQIQYGRPIQMIIWTAVTVMLIGAGFCCMHHQTSRTVD
ncbi:hypothetical protein KFK09_004491 [Dendrobium nobile]|uniref:Syntaxin 6/10/61 N-terminal domain-containing protein n=1 Tax=Dendrobium nobile TaxID=94219 RepID=A0A8T3C488_DENNO|nr:hypothetical protein KFK09_004491 [Dendrobium nobile]